MEWTQNILKAALDNGLNQADIARLTGLSAAHIGRLLSGQTTNVTQQTKAKLEKLKIYTNPSSLPKLVAPVLQESNDTAVMQLTAQFLTHLEAAEERYQRLEARYEHLLQQFQELKIEFMEYLTKK